MTRLLIAGDGCNRDRVIPLLLQQVQVGARVYALPVQAVRMERDGEETPAGGFFSDKSGRYGILVSGP